MRDANVDEVRNGSSADSACPDSSLGTRPKRRGKDARRRYDLPGLAWLARVIQPVANSRWHVLLLKSVAVAAVLLAGLASTPPSISRSVVAIGTENPIGGELRTRDPRFIPAMSLIAPDGQGRATNLSGDSSLQAIAVAVQDNETSDRAETEQRPPRFPVVRFEPAINDVLNVEPAIVVLDDSDPDYTRGQPHTDGLRLISADGKVLREFREFNNCETIGGIHGVAVDQQRGRIYAREVVGNRVLCLDHEGRKLWQVEKIEVMAIAVDSRTGHLWCSGVSSLDQGETVVLDQDGHQVAAIPVHGVDMEYDPHSDTFWLTGDEFIRVKRDGTVLFRNKVPGWCCASLSVDSTKGNAWMIERAHPDVAKSRNRLWRLNARGEISVVRDLEGQAPFCVECDPDTGDVWVATFNSGLLRFSADGDPVGHVDLKASNLALGRDGLWAVTETGVVRVDLAGVVDKVYEFDRPSQQAWLAVFGSAARRTTD